MPNAWDILKVAEERLQHEWVFPLVPRKAVLVRLGRTRRREGRDDRKDEMTGSGREYTRSDTFDTCRPRKRERAQSINKQHGYEQGMYRVCPVLC